MQHMQLPTCTNVRIRSTQDAHRIFFAVQQGVLHMVTRRLDADERLALGTGCVYAWEERGPHTEITGLGIERFTEGRRWSPSRVRDEFLFYYEKYSPPPDANQSDASSERQPPRDWDPLVKQTYSVWVETDKGRRKWHLTAYFTQTTVDQLGTIDDVQSVRELVVPDGIFKSTRLGKNRGKTDEQPGRSGDILKPSTTVTRTYAPFPTPYPSGQSPQAESSPQPVLMYEPYQNAYPSYLHNDGQSPPYSVSGSVPLSPSPQLSLPPIRESRQANHSPPDRFATSSPQHPTESVPVKLPLHRTTEALPRLPSGGQTQSYRYPAYPSSASPPHPPHPNQTGTYYAPTSQPPPQTWFAPPTQLAYTERTPGHQSRANAPAALTLRATHPSSLLPVPSSSYPQPLGGPSPVSDLDIPHSHTHARAIHSVSHSPSSRDSRSSLPGVSVPDSRSNCLPPLYIPEEVYPSAYELLSSTETLSSDGRRGSIGPCRDLAPLNTLARSHPYKRDPVDDKTLRLLGPRSS